MSRAPAATVNQDNTSANIDHILITRLRKSAVILLEEIRNWSTRPLLKQESDKGSCRQARADIHEPLPG